MGLGSLKGKKGSLLQHFPKASDLERPRAAKQDVNGVRAGKEPAAAKKEKAKKEKRGKSKAKGKKAKEKEKEKKAGKKRGPGRKEAAQPKTITAHQRVRKYPKEPFKAEDKNRLYCLACRELVRACAWRLVRHLTPRRST